MAKELNEKLLSQFLNDAKECFRKNDHRAFIVEDIKYLAIKELEGILKAENPKSFLMLVKNKVIAHEIAELLSESMGRCIVFETVEDVKKAIFNGEASFKNVDEYIERAKYFCAQYPRLILTAFDEEKTVLNAVLCQNKKKECLYNRDDKQSTPYTVSDFLAESRYSFLAIDDIYSMFSVVDSGSLKQEWVNPVKDVARFDRTEFRNMAYYTDLDHSAKKLKALAAGTRSCVVLSDKIMGGNIIEYMLALQIINERKSVLSIRDEIADMIEDYEDECGDIAYDIVPYTENNEDNTDILSNCMRLAKNAGRRVPGDIRGVAEYIQNELAYMTPEEIFVRVISGYQAAFPSARYSKARQILDRLNDEPSDYSKCFVEMFFSDPIKEQVELASHKAYLAEIMDNEKAHIMKSLVDIFYRYGVYHKYNEKISSIPYLICREGDGFEDLVKKNLERRPGVTYYSILGEKSDLFYEGLFIQNLFSREKAVRTPMLVMTNEDVGDMCAMLKAFLPDMKVTPDWKELTKKTDEPIIAVCAYPEMRDTPLWLQVNSAVFIDLPERIDELGCAINKVGAYCDDTLHILASFGSVDGLLIESLATAIPGYFKGKIPPIALSEIMLAGRTKEEFGKVLEDLNEVCFMFRDIVAGKSDVDKAMKAVARFKDVLHDYTDIPFSDLDAGYDMKYMLATGQSFSKICHDTATIGIKGEVIVTGDDSRKALFFNICSLALKHICDVKQKNCYDCKEYDRLKVNNYDDLIVAIKEYFEKAKEVIREIEEEKGKTESKISDGGVTEEIYKKFSIENSEKATNKILQSIAKNYANSMEGMFDVPYDIIENMRSQTVDVYEKVLDKYYDKIRTIFNDAFEQMLANYKSFMAKDSQVNEG